MSLGWVLSGGARCDLAGGMTALMKNMETILDTSVMTVTGKTMAENIKDAKVYLPDVIRTLDNPVMTEPGIGVLYGNLAPNGAVAKIRSEEHTSELQSR